MWFSKKPKEFKTVKEVNEFIKNENPYEGITEEEKVMINHIGTTLNNAIRSSSDLSNDILFQKELLQRLIKSHSLKEDIIVHRGVQSINYESMLAKERGYPDGYLYHNGFVYTALRQAYYHFIYFNIVVPVGTNYLYTGNFSNVIGIYPHNNNFEDTTCELILDIGTVFRINRKQIIIDKSGKKRIIYDVNVVNEYDIMN